VGDMSLSARWGCVDPEEKRLSLKRQCALLGLVRSSGYYRPAPLSTEDRLLMNLIDEQYTRLPFYGSRRMVVAL